MSIHVFAKMKIREGREEAVQAGVRDLVAGSQAEAGCVSYQAFVSNQDPTVIRVKEEWKNLDALQAHMQEPHFTSFGANHANDFAEPVEVDVTQSL